MKTFVLRICRLEECGAEFYVEWWKCNIYCSRSCASKVLMRERIRELWEDEGYRKKQIESHRLAWKREPTRSRMLKGKKKARRKVSLATKKSWSVGAVRRRRVAGMKLRFKDPVVYSEWYAATFNEASNRKRRSATRKFYRTHPEAVEKQRADSSARLAKIVTMNPEEPKRRGKVISKSLKKYFSNSDNRRKRSLSAKRIHKENPWIAKEHSKHLRKLYRQNSEFKRKWKASHTVHPNSLEMAMEELLKGLKIKFSFQKQVCGYFPDFTLVKYKIIIEVDGEYWHTLPLVAKKDRKKEREWKKAGYLVLRFWEKEVLKKKENVVAKILKAIESKKIKRVA